MWNKMPMILERLLLSVKHRDMIVFLIIAWQLSVISFVWAWIKEDLILILIFLIFLNESLELVFLANFLLNFRFFNLRLRFWKNWISLTWAVVFDLVDKILDLQIKFLDVIILIWCFAKDLLLQPINRFLYPCLNHNFDFIVFWT